MVARCVSEGARLSYFETAAWHFLPYPFQCRHRAHNPGHQQRAQNRQESGRRGVGVSECRVGSARISTQYRQEGVQVIVRAARTTESIRTVAVTAPPGRRMSTNPILFTTNRVFSRSRAVIGNVSLVLNINPLLKNLHSFRFLTLPLWSSSIQMALSLKKIRSTSPIGEESRGSHRRKQPAKRHSWRRS
jgi:hypothetical protein